MKLSGCDASAQSLPALPVHPKKTVTDRSNDCEKPSRYKDSLNQSFVAGVYKSITPTTVKASATSVGTDRNAEVGSKKASIAASRKRAKTFRT